MAAPSGPISASRTIAALADVHFAVQCQPQGARIRLLAADQKLLVNDQPANESDLAHGDRIRAGGTTFTVQYDGHSQSALHHGNCHG